MATEEKKIASSLETPQLQEREKVSNPMELLVNSIRGLDKFGGFNFLKGLIKEVEKIVSNAQNELTDGFNSSVDKDKVIENLTNGLQNLDIV